MIAAVITNGELGDVDKLMGILPEFDLVVCCDGLDIWTAWDWL